MQNNHEFDLGDVHIIDCYSQSSQNDNFLEARHSIR